MHLSRFEVLLVNSNYYFLVLTLLVAILTNLKMESNATQHIEVSSH